MSICRIEIPSWGAPRSTEYGAQIRVTVENRAVVLEANDAGLTELALRRYRWPARASLRGRGSRSTSTEGGLAEGSMPVILSRTDSSAGEERAWYPSCWIRPPPALRRWRVGRRHRPGGAGDLRRRRRAGRALRWLLAGPCSGASAARRRGPSVGAPDALSLRRVASTLDAGQYPPSGRSAQAPRGLPGAPWTTRSTTGAPLAERPGAPGAGWPPVWLRSRHRRPGRGGPSWYRFRRSTAWCPAEEPARPARGTRPARAIACSSLEPGVGLFAIAGEPEGCLFAANRLVDRAMRGHLLGFEFRALRTSGAERSPRLLLPVGERRLAPLSPAPCPIRTVEEDDEGRR